MEELVHLTSEELRQLQVDARRRAWWPFSLKLALGGIAALLGYAILLTSTYLWDRNTWQETFAVEVREQAKAEAALTMQEMQESWQQMQVEATLTMQEQQQVRESEQAAFATMMDQRLRRATDLLARAETINWALLTPEVERDVQLKERMDALATRNPHHPDVGDRDLLQGPLYDSLEHDPGEE